MWPISISRKPILCRCMTSLAVACVCEKEDMNYDIIGSIAVYELQATQYTANKLSEVFFLSFLFLEFCPTFVYTF